MNDPANATDLDHTPLELDLDLEPVDRRRKRSTDPLIALHYQLSYAKAYGELDAIVLADASGIVMAGAGSWASCEELAAYAPLLASDADATGNATLSSRVEKLRAQVDVRSIDVDGDVVLLCARGGPKSEEQVRIRGASVARAAAGVSRILRVPAA